MKSIWLGDATSFNKFSPGNCKYRFKNWININCYRVPH